MSVISTTGARIARLDNVHLAHRKQMRLIGALKLERSPQYPFSEASIMFISRRHNSLIQFLRPTGGAAKAIELTWGGLRHVPLLELGKS
jgi:hypothetical protein